MKKYRNARDVLPEELIQQIQKYVKGIHLYIPQTERDGWGTSTGSREEMKLRNEKICELYAAGIPLAELAELYSLSEERIRNIVYGQQRD